MEASLFGESGREKGSSTNIPRNSDKAIRKVENDVRKNRRVIKRKMTEESVKSSASIQQPSESRWEVISRGKTGWTQNRNNLASDQKKTTTKWDKDIEKVEWNKMSASQDLKEFTPSTARLASPGDLQSNRKTLFGAARRGSSLCSREEYEILKVRDLTRKKYYNTKKYNPYCFLVRCIQFSHARQIFSEMKLPKKGSIRQPDY